MIQTGTTYTKYRDRNSDAYNQNNEHPSNTIVLGVISPNIKYVRSAQRICDVILSAFLLLLLFPVFLFIALVIKLDSQGPVLFKQDRVGFRGKRFTFLKFRSMVPDAETKRCELNALNERSGPVFKIKQDPRITRVGKILRRSSLDELPQLINVLRGDMSLIGPRPALPAEVESYTPRQMQRLLVLPGLTGLWQVSGRSNVSFERSIELDLQYIQEQSIWLNVKIFFLTIPKVISGEGAY